MTALYCHTPDFNVIYNDDGSVTLEPTGDCVGTWVAKTFDKDGDGVISNDEMQKFADENQIFVDDKQLQTVMIAMAMWKPWFLKNIAEKVLQNDDLWENLRKLTTWLLDDSKPMWELYQALKQIAEQWLLNDFLEGWIAYCTDNWNPEQAERWIQMKKYLQANVNLDSILLYGLMK